MKAGSIMKEEGLTNEGRHHLLLSHNLAHYKKTTAGICSLD